MIQELVVQLTLFYDPNEELWDNPVTWFKWTMEPTDGL